MKKSNNIYHQYGGQDFSLVAKKTNFGQVFYLFAIIVIFLKTFQAHKMKY